MASALLLNFEGKDNSPLKGCVISPVYWDIFYDKTVIFAITQMMELQ